MLMGSVCQGVHRYLECLLAGRRPSQRLIFWKSGQICKCPIGLINKTCGFKSLSSIQMKDGTPPLLPPPQQNRAARWPLSLGHIRGIIYLNYSIYLILSNGKLARKLFFFSPKMKILAAENGIKKNKTN